MGMLPAIAARADSGLSAGVASQEVLGSMSWVQLLVAVPAGIAVPSLGRGRPALMGAVASETVKLTTLRSNWILVAVALVMIVGSGVLQGLALVSRLTDPRFAGQLIEARPMQFIDSVLWAQVLIAVVAVLAATGEFGSGQI
jgi:ABC-2 type transport system permease protein